MRKSLGILVIIIVLLILYFIMRMHIFDDAFMFIRYAHNINLYNTYGWNFREKSYGCTSIMYTFSTYVGLKLGLLDLLGQTKYLICQYLFYLILTLATAQYFIFKILSEKLNTFSYFVISLVSLATIAVSARDINGMDTTMSLYSNLLLAFVSISFYKERSRKYLLLMILFGYINFLVRPDNLLYSWLFTTLILLLSSKETKYFVFFFKCNFFIYSTHFILIYCYFGYFLPIPFYIKGSGFYDAYIGINKWNVYYYIFILFSKWILFIIGILYMFKRKDLVLILAFIIPFVLTIVYLSTKVQIMGFNGRYYIPSVIYLFALWIMLININYSNLFSSIFRPQSIIKLSLISILFVGFNFTILRLVRDLYSNKQQLAEVSAKKYNIEISKANIPTIGRGNQFLYINELINKISNDSFSIAATEHGFISSNNLKTRILCFAGLHNPLILKNKQWDSETVSKSLLFNNPDLIFMPHEDYVALTFVILNNKYFQKKYDYYPGYLDYGIAIAKNSKFKKSIINYFCVKYKTKNMTPCIY